MNYYEHEIKVKVIDGVLAHEQDWEWFIQHTENTFAVELKGDSLEETLNSLREVREVFYYLSKIHEVTDKPLPISKEWLQELDALAQFYNGSIDLCSTTLSSNFSIVMRLLIYAGKIYSQVKKEDHIYHVDIFTQRNLSLLERVDLFAAEEEKILQLIDAAPSILRNERQVFLDNINGVIVPADPDFINRHKHDLNNANCFSFATITDKNISVWEERELLNMLAVSVKEGKIVPKISWGKSFTPNFEIWTREVLSHIKDYFDSPIATFVVETIGYLLHGDIPSADTINKHFALLYELSKESEESEDGYMISMDCSSLEIICLFFANKCTSNIAKDSYIKYAEVLNKLYSNNCKYLLRKLLNNGALTDKTIIQKLHEEIELIRDKVGEINDYTGFTQYIQNEFIRGSVANSHFEELSAKFEMIAENVDDIRVAHLFLSYFEFLLHIKNNKDVSASKISLEILRIRTLWHERYFLKSCERMQTVKTDPILVPKEYSGQLLNYITLAPNLFATQRMKLEENELVKIMQSLSDSPFSLLFSKIVISKDFPSHPIFRIDGRHPIDLFYNQNIDRIRESYAYKFRNNLSANEYTKGVFERIKQEMQISLSLIKDVQPLYEVVAEQNPEYVFLEYSKDLRLAHLTQLFPVLENKIRKFGELFGIVPIRESLDECHRLKEPDTVLKLIIQYVVDMGGNLEDVSDMYFVHFCMFGENGMNIRNECIHGLDYYQGNRLEIGFKVALLSLYMVGWRMQVVMDNMKKEDTQVTEGNNQAEEAQGDYKTKPNRLKEVWNWFVRVINRISKKP